MSDQVIERAAVRVRSDLVGAAGYKPGASRPGAAKLSSNELGFPPLPSVLDAIAQAAQEPNRYPDNHATALREALGAHWGVDAEEVIVGCGSSLLSQELVQATCEPGAGVAFGWRSFEAYQLFARTANATALTVPNRANGAFDLEALAAKINSFAGEVGIVLLCTPNNPTGATLGEDELRAFLAAIPSDIPVVIDEAYQEFAPEGFQSVNLYREGHENVVMLRTFSKAYGLAGLRVGYAIGSPTILNAVQAIRSPFAVTAVAQAAAIAALAAQDELKERVAHVQSELQRVRAELGELGLEAAASSANFFWMPLGERAADFAAHCADENVFVRGFDGEGVRVSIGSSSDNDRFLAAARSWPALAAVAA